VKTTDITFYCAHPHVDIEVWIDICLECPYLFEAKCAVLKYFKKGLQSQATPAAKPVKEKTPPPQVEEPLLKLDAYHESILKRLTRHPFKDYNAPKYQKALEALAVLSRQDPEIACILIRVISEIKKETAAYRLARARIAHPACHKEKFSWAGWTRFVQGHRPLNAEEERTLRAFYAEAAAIWRTLHYHKDRFNFPGEELEERLRECLARYRGATRESSILQGWITAAVEALVSCLPVAPDPEIFTEAVPPTAREALESLAAEGMKVIYSTHEKQKAKTLYRENVEAAPEIERGYRALIFVLKDLLGAGLVYLENYRGEDRFALDPTPDEIRAVIYENVTLIYHLTLSYFYFARGKPRAPVWRALEDVFDLCGVVSVSQEKPYSRDLIKKIVRHELKQSSFKE